MGTVGREMGKKRKEGERRLCCFDNFRQIKRFIINLQIILTDRKKKKKNARGRGKVAKIEKVRSSVLKNHAGETQERKYVS